MTFKLSDLIKLPEKRFQHWLSCSDPLDNCTCGLSVHNKLLSDLANMEIEVDEEAIKKILIEQNKTGHHILNNYINQFSTVLVNEASNAIASQLPKLLKEKKC